MSWNRTVKACLLFLLWCCSASLAENFDTLCSERAAIERVYYQHRLGDKPPFEQALSRQVLERMVRQDRLKEATLNKVYGVSVTPAMVDAEVVRINATTRAPKILAELKAALGNNPQRFGETVARPVVVERLLRERFQNDGALHAAARRECEAARNELLTARTNGVGATELLASLKRTRSDAVTETTWELTPRPAAAGASVAEESEVKNRYGPQAQIISAPRPRDGAPKSYFDDLPLELQNILRVQLRQPGDVSAVIEMPGSFLLFLCKEKTRDVLSVSCLTCPKCNYEKWLGEQEKAR